MTQSPDPVRRKKHRGITFWSMGAEMRTYVAERNLEADFSGQPISHADFNDYFTGLSGDGYISKRCN